MDLADSYCEQRLKRVCEDLIKRSVSIENVSNLLAAAVKYNATVSNLKILVISQLGFLNEWRHSGNGQKVGPFQGPVASDGFWNLKKKSLDSFATKLAFIEVLNPSTKLYTETNLKIEKM